MMGPEIDVGALSQLSSENLRVVLRKIPGSKDLIIEQKLMKPLDKIAGMNLIKSCGVDKVFKLEAKRPDSVASTKVYLLTPNLEITKKVCNHLNTSVSSNASSTNVETKNNHSTCHLIFLPKILRQSEIILEEEGLHGKVILHSYIQLKLVFQVSFTFWPLKQAPTSIMLYLMLSNTFYENRLC